MNFKSILLSALVVLSSSVQASNKQIDVIYGDDNRRDVFESTNALHVELAKSTAAMISNNQLKASRGDVSISGGTLESRGICKKERFSQQMSAANCSGFMVSENLLVTAGHCIKSESDCRNFKWVFDYKVDHSEQGAVSVPSTSVYSCKKIISRALDQFTKDDFAVIELDRKTDRRPLEFRRRGQLPRWTSLVVIGHPTGLPTKITDGAVVRSYENKYFVTNLDTYGGNSGSAVFNARTGLVEGILVRGENDYVEDEKLGCMVSNVCENDGCRGEDVTYITNIEALKNI